MHAGRFDVLHQAADDDLAGGITEGIDIDLGGVLEVLVNQHRVIRLDIHRLIHIAVQLVLAVDHLHRPAAQDVTGAHHHGITNTLGHHAGLRFAAGQAIAGLTDVQATQDRFELLAVFRRVDRFGRGAPDAGTRGLTGGGLQPVQQGNRQLEGGLAAELNNHPLRLLGLDHVEHVLKGEGLEVEAIGGVVVGGDRLGVGVHHHRCEPLLLQREGGVDAAVIELDSLADPVGTAAQDHHLAPGLRLNLGLRSDQLQAAVGEQTLHRPLIGGVVIGRAGGELRGTGVHGFEHRIDAQVLAMGAHLQFLAAGGPGDLTIGEAQLLELQQGGGIQGGQVLALEQTLLALDDPAQLRQEPRIDGGDPMDVGIAVAVHHRRANRKDPIGCRGAQFPVEVRALGAGVRAIATPAGVSGLQGTQGLLEGLLKIAADGHGLAHRLHRGGQHGGAAAELLEGEAGDLRHHVINRGLETSRGLAGDVVDDLVEGVSDGQTRSDLGDRETCGFRGQGRTPRDAGIHLDHDHVAIGGIDRELNVAAAGVHTDLADDRDRLIPEALVLAVSQGLSRGHGDRVTGVHPHRIEVFDRADDHHVVGGVAHHLQLEFLPTEQGLLNQDLIHRAGVQAAQADRPELLGVVSDAAAAAPQGEGRANDPRIAADLIPDSLGLLQGRRDAGGADTHPNATHGLFAQVPVFRLFNRLEVGADQLHPVLLQGAVLGEGHRQVQGGLSAHGRQQGVRTLLLDHPAHHIRGERFDISAIRHVRIGHDRGGIAVHQHHLKTLGPQGFTRLGSRVIKFAGLPDHNRA